MRRFFFDILNNDCEQKAGDDGRKKPPGITPKNRSIGYWKKYPLETGA
jgi:hypothetical protein